MAFYNNRLNFTNRGCTFRAKVRSLSSLDAEIVYVEVQDPLDARTWIAEESLTGCLVSPNKKRASLGGSTHSVYRHVYDLLRGRTHTVNGYGVGPEKEGGGGEMDNVRRSRVHLLDLSNLVLAMHCASAEELERIRALRATLIFQLVGKRDEQKTSAWRHFEKSGKPDSLGRRNIARDSMLTFASAHLYANRAKAIGELTVKVNEKGLLIYQAIVEQIELIERLDRFLKRQVELTSSGLKPIGYLSPGKGTRGVNAFRLEAARAASAIRATHFTQPFHATVTSLSDALEGLATFGISENGPKRIQSVLQSCARILLRHRLEMEVVTPLSLRLADETRRKRHPNLATKIPSLSPDDLSKIVGRIPSLFLEFTEYFNPLSIAVTELHTNSDRIFLMPPLHVKRVVKRMIEQIC